MEKEKMYRIQDCIFKIGLHYELLKRKREHDYLEGTLKEVDYELLKTLSIYEKPCLLSKLNF